MADSDREHDMLILIGEQAFEIRLLRSVVEKQQSQLEAAQKKLDDAEEKP